MAFRTENNLNSNTNTVPYSGSHSTATGSTSGPSTPVPAKQLPFPGQPHHSTPLSSPSTSSSSSSAPLSGNHTVSHSTSGGQGSNQSIVTGLARARLVSGSGARSTSGPSHSTRMTLGTGERTTETESKRT